MNQCEVKIRIKENNQTEKQMDLKINKGEDSENRQT